MPEGEWTRIVALADCQIGRGRYVTVREHELAVFHLADAPEQIIVTRNSCPHAGGNLAAGAVTGTVVTCPWHQWPFDLVTGSCPLSEKVALTKYPSRVQDGWIWALLPR